MVLRYALYLKLLRLITAAKRVHICNAILLRIVIKRSDK